MRDAGISGSIDEITPRTRVEFSPRKRSTVLGYTDEGAKAHVNRIT